MKTGNKIWITVGILLAVGLLIAGVIWAYKRNRKNTVTGNQTTTGTNNVTKPKPFDPVEEVNESAAAGARDVLTPQ